MLKFADIILPVLMPNTCTYAVPDLLVNNIAVGKRVEVQFGKKRMIAGIVKKIFDAESVAFNTKPIISIIDAEPITLPQQLQLWQFISQYYLCSEGEVMLSALPSAFRLSSETVLILNANFTPDLSLLDDQEFLVAEALSLQNELSITEVQAIIDKKNVYHLIKSMLEKGVIAVKEELVERYKPKTATYIQMLPAYKQNINNELKNLFEKLARAPKQQAILMAYMQISAASQINYVSKKELLEKANADTAALKMLIDKQVFMAFEQVVSRLEGKYLSPTINYELSTNQQVALNDIIHQFQTRKVVLLHGVTSSGKTQIYIQLIKQAIAQGKQVLYLLPEIALTTQMISRLQNVFGDEIGVYHSRFNDQERIEIWQRTLKSEYKVILGARSALFLPFANLDLVIVDEEHDPSYKQNQIAPRYHARDTAIYLASLYGAKTLLGSATPSIESYYHACQSHKYGLVTLQQRYGGVKPPFIEIINMFVAQQQKTVHSHFSTPLITQIKAALANKQQVIIFQNRRGYSPYLICETCQHLIKCHQCDVSLTYHKFNNELKCHYCGYSKKNTDKCEACQSTNIQIQGFGTEKIEDELKILLPNVNVARLDLDSTRAKKSFQQIINDFEEKKIDILVGTQMVTKGLDFENVNLVGIISADQLLHFPDFRANERAFQLMQQVSGRAGRRNEQGKVIIQAINTKHAVLQYVVANNYNNFYAVEIAERRKHSYPPFVRLLCITLKHQNNDTVNKAGFELAKNLKSQLEKRLLGPTVPIIAKIRNYFLRNILIKLEPNSAQITYFKQFITQQIQALQQQKDFKNLIIVVDVDVY